MTPRLIIYFVYFMLVKYLFSSVQTGLRFQCRSHATNLFYTSNSGVLAFYSTTTEKQRTSEKRRNPRINLNNIKEQLQTGVDTSVLGIKDEKKKIPVVKALKDADSKEEIRKTLEEKSQIEDHKLALRVLRCADVRSPLTDLQREIKDLKVILR